MALVEPDELYICIAQNMQMYVLSSVTTRSFVNQIIA